MPNLNGTGPMGQGPCTGRGMGNCGGAKNVARGGCGCRRRFGGSARFSQNNTQSLEDEEKFLLEELEVVRKEKKNLKKEK